VAGPICSSDAPQCMHLHLPCVLSGPPQRHGDKEDSAQAMRSGTQNPHIVPTWVLELIQCWEEMDREQSQNSSEP